MFSKRQRAKIYLEESSTKCPITLVLMAVSNHLTPRWTWGHRVGWDNHSNTDKSTNFQNTLVLKASVVFQVFLHTISDWRTNLIKLIKRDLDTRLGTVWSCHDIHIMGFGKFQKIVDTTHPQFWCRRTVRGRVSDAVGRSNKRWPLKQPRIQNGALKDLTLYHHLQRNGHQGKPFQIMAERQRVYYVCVFKVFYGYYYCTVSYCQILY